jgi:alpha-ketoglutarate-dependent taurine dioxygenase
MDAARPGLGARKAVRLERKPVGLASEDLCKLDLLQPDQSLPLVVRPAVTGVDLAAWLKANRGLVSTRLAAHGGLLFRGFEIRSPEQFQECIEAVSAELLEYNYGSTPRSQVSGRIYTSTEYPPDQWIPLHNEMAYARTWPMKIWFFCATPASSGGQTPLADSRKVTARISREIRRRFDERGVLYVRNYGHGVDLPWQAVFQTEDRSQVEDFCRQEGMSFEWRGEERLVTRQKCQASALHPRSLDRIWFNQAHLFHVSALEQRVRDSLSARFGEEELPRNAYFGDGSPLDESELQEIRDAYERETVLFTWEAGDVVLVDNMLTAHGRAPFEGPRKVLVGMAESHGGEAR